MYGEDQIKCYHTVVGRSDSFVNEPGKRDPPEMVLARILLFGNPNLLSVWCRNL